MTTPDAPLPPTPPVTPETGSTPASRAAPTTSAPAPGTAPATPVLATPPVASVIVATRPSGGRWINVLLGLAAVIAVGGVAFAVGRSTAPASAVAAFPGGNVVIEGPTGSFDPGSGPGVRPGGPGFLGAAGPTLEGTVTAVDAESITVELASGDELTIALDDATTYHEATHADASAVRVGDEVAVQADGGMIAIGGDGSPTDPGDGGLSASDVTVRR